MSFNGNRKFVTAILCSVILSITMVDSVLADAYIQTWDLVDSGKHLDYDGNSKYMSYANTGASIWNGYKSGVIRRDSVLVIQDVYISDINKANGNTGVTYSNGKIELNKYYLENCTDDQITNTVTHELGHALGLDHGPLSSDIMYSSQTNVKTLSQNDKDSYDAAYNNY